MAKNKPLKKVSRKLTYGLKEKIFTNTEVVREFQARGFKTMNLSSFGLKVKFPSDRRFNEKELKVLPLILKLLFNAKELEYERRLSVISKMKSDAKR